MRRIFALAAVVPALIAGCTPAAQPTPSTPAPVITAPTLQLMCTPEEGGTASPCTQAEYDAMIARDKLYDEAKSVLSKYDKEYERLARAGAEASEELLSFTAGEFTQQTREDFSNGTRFEGGKSIRVWVKRLVGESRAGSAVALETCSDTSSVTIVQGDQMLGKGRVALQRFFFDASPDALRIVAVQSKEVATC